MVRSRGAGVVTMVPCVWLLAGSFLALWRTLRCFEYIHGNPDIDGGSQCIQSTYLRIETWYSTYLHIIMYSQHIM